MEQRNRITQQPDIMGGKACIRGMRDQAQRALLLSWICLIYACGNATNTPTSSSNSWDQC